MAGAKINRSRAKIDRARAKFSMQLFWHEHIWFIG